MPRPPDELAIDLHEVEREALQVAERRLTGAELVEADLDAQRPQVADGGVDRGLMADEDALGDLEAEPFGRQPCRIQGSAHVLGQLRIGKLPGRDVDVELLDAGRAAVGAPRRELRARALQHDRAETGDEPTRLGRVDELRGRQQRAFVVVHTKQGLGPDRHVGVDVDDRLVVHDDRVVVDGMAQLLLDRLAVGWPVRPIRRRRSRRGRRRSSLAWARAWSASPSRFSLSWPDLANATPMLTVTVTAVAVGLDGLAQRLRASGWPVGRRRHCQCRARRRRTRHCEVGPAWRLRPTASRSRFAISLSTLSPTGWP